LVENRLLPAHEEVIYISKEFEWIIISKTYLWLKQENGGLNGPKGVCRSSV
jgi:hypothetical protein